MSRYLIFFVPSLISSATGLHLYYAHTNGYLSFSSSLRITLLLTFSSSLSSAFASFLFSCFFSRTLLYLRFFLPSMPFNAALLTLLCGFLFRSFVLRASSQSFIITALLRLFCVFSLPFTFFLGNLYCCFLPSLFLARELLPPLRLFFSHCFFLRASPSLLVFSVVHFFFFAMV